MEDLLRHLIIFGVSLQIPCLCVGLTCLQSTNIPIPRDSARTKTCGSHEVCYIDQIATQSGYIRYNLGCRDSQFCTSLSGRRSAETLVRSLDIDLIRNNSSDDLSPRSSGDVKICDSCCNTDLCNNAGCKASGYLPRSSRGPVCYTCAQHRSPELCDSISVCGINSICKVKLESHPTTGDIYYTSKCEDPQVCHQDAVFKNIIVGKKRLTEEVDTASHKCVVKCCDGDLCNGHCGSGTVVGGTSGGTPDPCSSNPCVHGTCSVSQGTYQCNCQSGATGHNCDTFPCSPNPCVHGTCSVSQGTYHCTCQSAATGRNCATLPNPCLSSPCQYGTCLNLGTSYQCQCNSGYSGTNCDQAPNPCLSNPCHQGTCHSYGRTSYYCTCHSGYSGINCDQVPNPCAASPCAHGTCYHSGSSYGCTCLAGWAGVNCDQYVYVNPGSGGGSCASGWVRHGSSCYLVKKEKQTWSQAKSICSHLGAYLAEVTDQSEESFLIQEAPVAHQGDWWLGGIKQNGHWRWHHSGHSLGSGFWGSHRPSKNGFDCLEIQKTIRAWNNEDCHHPNYYICEK